MNTSATISALYIYSIKSTRRIELNESAVETIGLAHDRRRAVVNAAANRILTGRDCPALLGLNTSITASELLLSCPTGVINIPLTPRHEEITRVNLWAEEGHPGIRYSDPVNRWLSDALGLDCYLIYLGEGCQRGFPSNMASGYTGQPGDLTSYADDYPILLTSEASLDDLNTHLTDPVTMHHFRPNIVVNGCEAFAEDAWQRIRIGECEFELAQRCPRCVFTTIDPETQEKHPRQEPLRTLAAYRKIPSGGAGFGVQMVPRRLGRLRVGDEIIVLT